MSSIRSARAILGLCLLLTLCNVAAAAGSMSLLEANAALPDCARSCLLTAISHSTCNITDVDCICSNQSLNANATACIRLGCEVKDALAAKNITSQLCGLPVENGQGNVPVYAVFIGLAIVAVILRIIARIVTQAYFWWDDFCNLFGFIGAALFAALNIWSINLGQGMDMWFVPFDNITRILQLFYGEMLLYTLTRFFVRASIILFYLRVFPPKDNNKLGRLIQYTMVFNVVYNLSFFIAVLFQCTPISLFWTSWEGHQEGYCGNANILVWVAAATGIVYDLWLLALPFPQLLALNVHWKKKVMGGMMFCVGAAVTIISLVRLKTINEFTRTENPTKDIVGVCLWSGIELDVGVICPCLPSLRLLLRRLLPRVLGTTGKYEMDPVSNATGNMRSAARRSQGNAKAMAVGGTTAGGVTDAGNGGNRHSGHGLDAGGPRAVDRDDSQDGMMHDGRSCDSFKGLVGGSSDEESQGRRGKR
ncbi:hypothetical protein N656DRAFT_646079 [Canariomyces notabilis]|uniref:CFEM domain-containing protein n=1 Tax=Canariomyces notabilis TaxID=2074819 RepID=A0AAN6TF12_9PEZI|nr:hypothetical protein N656DRAFT_646079 [Canariomyces arenarius]